SGRIDAFGRSMSIIVLGRRVANERAKSRRGFYTPSERCGSTLLASLDRIVEQIIAATVKSAPPTHPSPLGCVVIIQPPSPAPLMRGTLSIEGMAPKTPAPRWG